MDEFYSLVRTPGEYDKSYDELLDEYNAVEVPEFSDKSYDELIDEYNSVKLQQDTPLSGMPDSTPSTGGVSGYDYLSLVGAATGEAVNLVGKIWGVQGMLSRKLRDKAHEFVGIESKALPGPFETMGKYAKEAGKTAKDFWEKEISPAMKKEEEKTILAGVGDEGIFADDISVHKIGSMIARSLPTTVAGMGVGFITTKALLATGLRAVPSVIAKPMVKLFGEGATAGIIGGAIGEGSVAGVMNADSIYEQISNTPDEELVKSDTYKFVNEKLATRYPDPIERHEAVKAVLSVAGAAMVGVTTAATTGFLGAPSGAVVGKIISGESKSIFKNILMGAITEGLVEENLQSGVERIVENAAVKHLVDPKREYFEGVAEAMVSGAATGMVMGGGMAGIATSVTKLADKAEKFVEKIEKTEQEETDTVFEELKKDILSGKVTQTEAIAIQKELRKTQDGIKRADAIDTILEEIKTDKSDIRPPDEKQQKAIKAIDELGVKTWGDNFKTGSVKIAQETDETKAVQNVMSEVGMGEVVFYDAAGTQFGNVNGFHNKGQVYVNINTKKPLLVVAGHESLHKLRNDAPGLYKKFISAVKGSKVVGFKEYVEKINSNREKIGLPELTKKDKLAEEFIADFAADSFANPEFWKRMHTLNPKATKTLAKILVDLIKQFRKAFTAKNKQFFKDVDAVSKLAEVYAEYSGISEDRRWVDIGRETERRVSQRRVDEIKRKKIDEMTEEERKIALKYHELTGLMSKRAYDESEKKPVQVNIDVDDLKWVNDTFGHEEGGDELLKLVGKALSESGIDAYHISGDEFRLQADTMAEAGIAVKKAIKYLENNLLTVIDTDGTTRKYKAGFSYGTGKSKDAAKARQQAEEELKKHKLSRKLPERGEKPKGRLEESAEGDKAKGGERAAGEKIIPPDNDQLIKLALDEDIKYTKKVKIGNRTTTATKNAGEALSDVIEKRTAMKRILDCAA